ncbi:MAG: hypothetical protein ACOCNC_02510 [Acetivibrio ethanolgignens]
MKSKEEIDKMMETAEGIAIYGAGVVAQNAYLLVNQLLKKEFRGFLVSHYDSSDSKIKMTDAMYHKPIRDIFQYWQRHWDIVFMLLSLHRS